MKVNFFFFHLCWEEMCQGHVDAIGLESVVATGSRASGRRKGHGLESKSDEPRLLGSFN